MKIYMDVCCLNRPFDDQYQDRIRIEAEAIMSILFHCQQGEWQLVVSDVIDIEINKMQNANKKQKVAMLATVADDKVSLDDEVELRAITLNKLGIGLFDSLHIACAEKYGVDIMLSTDDNLIRRANRISDIRVRVENPVKWLMEVTSNEYDN